MSSASEKRRFARAPIELKVEYKRLNTFFADYTRNISKGGTFIKTKKPLGIGTEFVFKLHIPTLGAPIELRGEVKWVVEEGGTTPDGETSDAGMGIRFLYDDAAQRLLIEQ